MRRSQREFAFWCLKNKVVFDTVAKAERDAYKAELRFESGGNPLMLKSFMEHFESVAEVRALLYALLS